MPGPNEIESDIRDAVPAWDSVRFKHLKALAQHSDRDAILYVGNIDSQHRDSGVIDEDTRGMMKTLNGLRGDKLDIILHSRGGSGDVAEQIGNYLRSKYRHIRAIVPQKAMSAATMLACACDEIIMGKHSAIGPIDPQIQMPGWGGHSFPVAIQSILDEFETAKREVVANPETASWWLSRVDHPAGFLVDAQKAVDRAEAQVREWLDGRMLKNDKDAARQVAAWLAKGDHKQHGRPINIKTAKDKGLNVVALEDDQELQDLVLSVFHATVYAMKYSGQHIVKIIENQNGLGYQINMRPTN